MNTLNFNLTEEQAMIKETIRDFAESEIAPVAMENDEKGVFPKELAKKMSEIGLLGLVIPEEYGGSGADMVSYAIAVEEVSRIDGAMGLTVAAHNSLCTFHIYMAGNEEQRKKYVVPLAQGDHIGAWGLTEPEAGSDAAAVKTTAHLDGNEWVINGTKTFITNATVANTAVCVANTDKAKGHKGISSFIVEYGTPGFTIGKKEDKLGIRASDTGELIFDNCRIPKENLLGELNRGFYDVLKILDGGRISIAAMALGLGQGALDLSIKYSKEREQFGKPINRFQAIQWFLADMATEIEVARLLTYKAAYLKDQGLTVNRESAMAKLYAAEAGMKACTNGIQVHGGYGYMREYDIQRHYRDIKLCEIGEGTSEIQRMIIARNLLK